MADETNNQGNGDREDQVRNRAYEIWEREGRKDGEHERHWHEARRELETGAAGADAVPQDDLLQSGPDLADDRSGADPGETVFDQDSVVVENGETGKGARRGRLLG